MVGTTHQVPRIRMDRDGSNIITTWGLVGGQILRAGDRLIIGEAQHGSLLLLNPRGRGRPMLGRRTIEGLVAEPGGVPASELRWRVAGGVESIERRLERGSSPTGTWYASVRIILLENASLDQLAAARRDFMGGWIQGRELDDLCMRGAVAPERYGVALAIGLAAHKSRAAILAADTEPGTIRFDVDLRAANPSGQVIVGPWLTNPEPDQLVEPLKQAVNGDALPRTGQWPSSQAKWSSPHEEASASSDQRQMSLFMQG